MQTLIVAPLRIELKYLVGALNQLGFGLVAAEGHFQSIKHQVICGAVGHGKVEFALGCQKFLLQNPGIKTVIGVGGAGSLVDRVLPFDLVVTTQIIEHDYQEKFDTQAVLPTFATTEDLVGRFREVLAANFSIHFGPIAAGDEDIVESKRAQQVHRATNALAVTWESAGLARACRRQSVDFVEIRGITDSCSGPVAESFKLNLPQAMENIALVLNEGLFSGSS